VTDISRQKSAARTTAFAARKTAHATFSGADATQNLLHFLTPHLGKAISAYMPMRTEIDCLPAMAELAKSGPIAVPVITGPGQRLQFHRWLPGCALKDGPFGAKIPVKAHPVTPEIVILPLLAFDTKGNRLGYGGGYYDRTLAELRAAGPILAVGFAYAAQQIDAVPTDPTDQPLDAIVTDIQTLLISSLFR